MEQLRKVGCIFGKPVFSLDAEILKDGTLLVDVKSTGEALNSIQIKGGLASESFTRKAIFLEVDPDLPDEDPNKYSERESIDITFIIEPLTGALIIGLKKEYVNESLLETIDEDKSIYLGLSDSKLMLYNHIISASASGKVTDNILYLLLSEDSETVVKGSTVLDQLLAENLYISLDNFV